MTTSGQYLFDPAAGQMVLYAYNMCGIRPTSLLQEHFEAARMAANMLLGRWSSAQGVNTWAVDLQTIPLIQGQQTYTVPTNTITMLDAYITIGNGGATTNRIITPISRTEYASYPNPLQQGFPTVFWYDKLITNPTVTLYEVPDGTQISLNYYRMRQIQDSNLTGGQTVEVPYYFLEAFSLGLAQRLATIWAPEKAAGLKMLADEAYEIAVTQNTEVETIYVSPQISSYFRA